MCHSKEEMNLDEDEFSEQTMVAVLTFAIGQPLPRKDEMIMLMVRLFEKQTQKQ